MGGSTLPSPASASKNYRANESDREPYSANSVRKPQLYPFQGDLVRQIREAFRTHKRVLAVSVTGSGKTTIFSDITCAAAARGKRVYVLVHRVEIVRQIVSRLASFGVRSGQIRPGAPQTTWPVQVAMIQTLARRLEKLPRPDFIVIDESHHATSGLFRKMLAHWPDVRVLGVTATPLRLDGKGLGEVFQAMVVGPSMRWLIDNGYLADFILYAPGEKIDLRKVRSTAGDYNSADLEAVINTRVITGNVVKHYAEHLNGLPAIAFCINLAHCRAVRDQFRESGWTADIIEGAMDDEARQMLVRRLAGGSLNVLVSCEVVNEGFDVPTVSGALLLRPTKSLGLYLQQVGRSLRVKSDGSKAIILDHAGISNVMGPPDVERPWSLEGKVKIEAGSRHCEKCERVFAAGVKRSEITNCCPSYEVCPLLRVNDAPTELKSPEVIDGVLTVYKPPDWTEGIPLHAGMANSDYKLLMERSRGLQERLEQIRKARGYKPGWTYLKKSEFDGDGNWRLSSAMQAEELANWLPGL